MLQVSGTGLFVYLSVSNVQLSAAVQLSLFYLPAVLTICWEIQKLYNYWNEKMKSVLRSLICTLLFCLSAGYSQESGIIPLPVKSAFTSDRYVISEGQNIFITSADRELRRIAEVYRHSIYKRTGIELGIKKGNPARGIVLVLDRTSTIKPDGYELSIDNNTVKITASNCCGVFYAVQSLNQLLKRDKDIYYTGASVTDYPRYAHRGFSFDASRHFQSTEYVKKIIDVMAQLKLNIFHWHLTDDEGWRIESKKYPALNRIGSYRDSLNAKQRNGYYTAAEIKEIIRYAKDRYIRVIPEVEMPGHSRAFMASYPQLLCPTNPGGNTICAGNAQSYKFMKDILEEVVGIFGTDIIHVGGDERPKGIWEKCPVCKDMITAKGLRDEDMLQNYFLKDICDHITSKGIKTIGWYENLKDGVPQGQIVEAWHSGEAWESARKGYVTINADCPFVYFDYPNNAYEKKFKPGWMPILDVEKVYSFDPTPDSLNEVQKKLIIGSECALWTEIIYENDIQYQLFPRILAFAEDVWTPAENKDYKKFAVRLNSLKPFFRAAGFEYDDGERIIDGK